MSLQKQSPGKKRGKRRLDHVKQILEEMDLDPFEGLAEICTKKTDDGNYFYPVETRVPCLKELASYVAPKLRSMEIDTGSVGANLGFQIIQFGEVKNGNSAGNNSRLGHSGGHEPVQLPVHVHGEHERKSESNEKVNNPSVSGDGGSQFKSNRF
jgi:hypothetical protein